MQGSGVCGKGAVQRVATTPRSRCKVEQLFTVRMCVQELFYVHASQVPRGSAMPALASHDHCKFQNTCLSHSDSIQQPPQASSCTFDHTNMRSNRAWYSCRVIQRCIRKRWSCIFGRFFRARLLAAVDVQRVVRGHRARKACKAELRHAKLAAQVHNMQLLGFMCCVQCVQALFCCHFVVFIHALLCFTCFWYCFSGYKSGCIQAYTYAQGIYIVMHAIKESI
jgi:hypothetical protein